MSIWQKLTDIFRPTYHISFDMADAMTIIQGQSETELYKTQPHLRTVISFLADNVAQVGLKEFRRISDTDRQRITDSPLINLLKQPNPDMTGFELLRQLTADLALHDVAYWIVTQAPDRDMERFGGWQIRPIPPSWVTAKQEGSVFAPASYRVDTGLGRGWIDVPAEDMLVFHGWNPTDPTNGVTPVMALKDIINEQIQAWSYRTQTWQRGGRVGTVLVRPKDAPPWDDTARERFARGWKEFTDKGARAGSTPLLEDGMELKRLGFNAREEEFSEVTKLSLQTVASIYHVSPVMVGILDNANFSNTKEFRKMLYSETLGPTMRMIEDRLNTFLATMIGADPLDYVEFDIRAKLSGDFEEQASVLSTSVGAPWITPNEARATQNLPRIEGGDSLTVPLNVTQGGQASPQDGGDPIRPSSDTDETAKNHIIAMWRARLDKSVRSKLGAGIDVESIGWLKWQNELQSDLTITAHIDQFNSGLIALDETRKAHNEYAKEQQHADQTA